MCGSKMTSAVLSPSTEVLIRRGKKKKKKLVFFFRKQNSFLDLFFFLFVCLFVFVLFSSLNLPPAISPPRFSDVQSWLRLICQK